MNYNKPRSIGGYESHQGHLTIEELWEEQKRDVDGDSEDLDTSNAPRESIQKVKEENK